MAEVLLAITMAQVFYLYDLELETPDYVLKTKTAPTPGPAMSFKVRIKGLRKPSKPVREPAGEVTARTGTQ